MSDLSPFDEPLRARKGRAGSTLTARRTLPRTQLERLVRHAPEVLVKITSSGKSLQRIRSQVTYISRHGRVSLEDEQGNVFLGESAVVDALYTWDKGRIPIPKLESDGHRRESFHVVWSMPAGTDRAAVTSAVRSTTAELFGGHEYVFATHDDQPQSHVHVVVKITGVTGLRLNPRKADLRRWREVFADTLDRHGIEAAATPRAYRGRTMRAAHQAVRHIDERAEAEQGAPSRVSALQSKAAESELAGAPHRWSERHRLDEQRNTVMAEYRETALALLSGTPADRQLAVALTRFAQQLPPVETRHEALVKALQNELLTTESTHGTTDFQRER